MTDDENHEAFGAMIHRGLREAEARAVKIISEEVELLNKDRDEAQSHDGIDAAMKGEKDAT